MSSPTVFVGFSKIKSTAGFTARSMHNTRTGFCENANKEATPLNKELISEAEGRTYLELFRKRIEDCEYYRDHEFRKNGVFGIDVCVSTNQFQKLTGVYNQEAWEREVLKWLRDTFGEKNVMSAIVHFDEKTPHIHALVIPVDENGKLNCAKYIGNNEKLSSCIDSLAGRVGYLGIERGVKGSVARHNELKQFYAAVKQAQKEELPTPKPKETATEYRERANAALKVLEQKKVQEISELKSELGSTKGLLKQAESEIEEGHDTEKRLEERIKHLEKELESFTERVKQYDSVMYAIEQGLPNEEQARQMEIAIEQFAKLGEERAQEQIDRPVIE